MKADPLPCIIHLGDLKKESAIYPTTRVCNAAYQSRHKAHTKAFKNQHRGFSAKEHFYFKISEFSKALLLITNFLCPKELPLTRKQYGALGRLAPNPSLHSQHNYTVMKRLDWTTLVVLSHITLPCAASDGHERVPLFLKLRPPLEVLLERAVNQRKSLSGSERLAVLSEASLIVLWSLLEDWGR
ncbi:hypothetical protein BJY01DRAFT_141612 [Aspergillus pseudoustus]|uniref:Uncharacterized protein n=1 Tax=Aspergillus pseudoustus TaxID=1810923 RepID=A0ABR4KB59_9EURO